MPYIQLNYFGKWNQATKEYNNLKKMIRNEMADNWPNRVALCDISNKSFLISTESTYVCTYI